MPLQESPKLTIGLERRSRSSRSLRGMMSLTCVISPPPSLRIAVLGVGRIGSTFAFQLARDGRHDVTVVARSGSERLQQLERDQAIVDVEGQRASVKVTSKLDEHVPYDLIIVTLLAHQAEPLLSVLRRSSAQCIQFMFNTFNPEHLENSVGLERCALGMPFVRAMLTAEGKLKVTIPRSGQKTIMNQQRWVDLFNAAGIPTALEAEMSLWLRCHAPLCIAFESVSVAGERRGGGASWETAYVLARGVAAGFKLIAALGYPIYPEAKQSLARKPVWFVAAVLWSMSRVRPFRRLLSTGEFECRSLVNVMAAAASRAQEPRLTSDIEAMMPQ